MASRAFQSGELVWTANVGRNGFDLASDILPGQVCEAVNITLERNQLGRKRYGSATQTITGSFTGYNALGSFVPAQDETARELFIIDRAGVTIGHVAAGTTFAALSLPTGADSISAKPYDAVFAALNGKLYIALRVVDNGLFAVKNRLLVYDPNLSTTALRWAGLPRPAAPTVSNTGSGTYPNTLRYYRIAWRVMSGGTIQRQGNLGSASAPFTPSGTGTAARVAKPTTSGEGETHWVVYGSVDDTTYYELAVVAVGTTTYDDTELPNEYSDDNEASPIEGVNTPWPSVKYILSTGTRLVGFGVYATTQQESVYPRPGRVYFSPVIDTSDVDDDERVSDDQVGLSATGQGWIDVGRNSGAEDRALAGPLDGNILVFQSRGFYMLVETEEVEQPYERVTMSPIIGAVNQWSTFMGEDENGTPCVYWLDPNRGPYRYGSNGTQWCGYDVQDIWATVNLNATTKVAHGIYDPTTRRCYWWLATGTSDEPGASDPILVFSVRDGQSVQGDGVRLGWTVWYGAVAAARCSVIFSTTIGATMSRALSPYAGLATSLLRLDDSSVTRDGTTKFQAYLTSKAWEIQPSHANKRLGNAYIKAKSGQDVRIQQSLLPNYGTDDARTSIIELTPQGNETRVLVRLEDAELVDAYTFQTTLGDERASANGWTLDEWICTVEPQEER